MEINKISKISCKHRGRGNLTYRLSVEPEQGRGGCDEWNLCQLRMTFSCNECVISKCRETVSVGFIAVSNTGRGIVWKTDHTYFKV